MTDPTAANRKAVAQAIIPSKSPLGQSLDEQYQKEEEQLATDEANNLVMQRPAPVLPSEAQAFANPQVSIPQVPAQTQAFVNPNAPQVQAQRAPAEAPLASPALQAPEVAIPDQTGKINQATNDLNTQVAAVDSEMTRVQKEKEEALKKLEEDDKNIPKIEPHGFFHGKSTWQKILGGVGMFLGSITPEGARNVANIIDTEINRDIDAQKTNIKLKQDKNDKSYQRLLEKYGSQEGALLAKKRDAFGLLDAHMKSLEMNARNAETRARIQQGRQEIDIKRQALSNDLMTTMMKQQQELMKGSVPGYQGQITDPAAANNFKEQVVSYQSALPMIKELEDMAKIGGSSLSPEKIARANQLRTLLKGQLRVILVGPGAVNESEQKLMDSAISDPTSFFSLQSNNLSKLGLLKQSLRNKVDATAAIYGLTKITPANARKM